MSEIKDARKRMGLDSEEYYFYQRDQELIAKLREKEMKEKGSHLRLIQGGKSGSEQPLALPSPEQASASQKKAA